MQISLKNQISQRSVITIRRSGASFTKRGKSYTAKMAVKISAGDLIAMCKIKNTDATSHLHVDHCNIPSAEQISAITNKEIKKPQYVEKNRRPKNKGLLEV